jgi:hypothetical protein
MHATTIKTQAKKGGAPEGYKGCGEMLLSERFNVNNKELNKQRFMETNANIYKNKVGNKRLTGAKFVAQEISFELTPSQEVELEEKVVKAVPKFEMPGEGVSLGGGGTRETSLLLQPAAVKQLPVEEDEVVDIDEDDLIIDEDNKAIIDQLMMQNSESENSNSINIPQQKVLEVRKKPE